MWLELLLLVEVVLPTSVETVTDLPSHSRQTHELSYISSGATCF